MTDKDEIDPDPETIRLLYDEISHQYDLVTASLDSLNNKAIGILAFNGTLLSLSSLSVVQLISKNVSVLFVIGVISSYFCILASAFFSIKSYKVVSIQATNAETLHKNYYLEKKSDVMDQLCSNIAYYTEENRNHSKEKAKYINSSLKYTVLAMIFITISLIIGFFGNLVIR